MVYGLAKNTDSQSIENSFNVDYQIKQKANQLVELIKLSDQEKYSINQNKILLSILNQIPMIAKVKANYYERILLLKDSFKLMLEDYKNNPKKIDIINQKFLMIIESLVIPNLKDDKLEFERINHLLDINIKKLNKRIQKEIKRKNKLKHSKHSFFLWSY